MKTLNAASRRVGLGMILDKNKVIFNEHIIPETISAEGVAVEVV